MFLLKLYVSACLAAAPAPGPETVQAIDAEVTACTQKSEGVTLPMRECLGHGSKRLDQHLNALYQALLKRLDPEGQALLKDAQRKWVAFRDAELKLSWKLDPNEGGTLQLLTASSYAYELLKARAATLESYASPSEP